VATSWIVGGALADNEVEKADASLNASARAGVMFFERKTLAALKRAKKIAREPAVQRAFRRDDRAALQRLASTYPDVTFFSRGRPVAGREAAVAARSTAWVRQGRRTLGRIVAEVPVGATLRRQLLDEVPRPDGDEVLVTRLGLLADEPGDVRLRGERYRAVAARLLPDRGAPQLVVLRPRDRIEAARDDVWRDVALAALATLIALAVIAFALAPAVARGRLAQQQRAQAVRVLAHVGDGVFLVDRAGVIRFWNPAAEAITGMPAASVVGRDVQEAIPGWVDVRERVPVADPPGERGERARAETVPVEIGGKELWLSLSGVDFADGRVYAFRDLTEERRLEELKTGFVATVSHELRTPLASIYGAAKTLEEQQERLPEKALKQLLSIISEQSAHLARLVSEIILASQLDLGTVKVANESFEPVELARGVVEAVRGRLPEGVSIGLRAPSALVPVAGDTDKARQVLSALIENAANYSPGGGEITVGLAKQDGNVRFSVHDEGIGIPVSEHDRIFEKFYRLDPNMTGGVGGVGLGLYIARELVKHMNGTIWVVSEPGSGSTFAFELPVAREAEASSTERARSTERA
jgi:PAS domain S-box-containing protein